MTKEEALNQINYLSKEIETHNYNYYNLSGILFLLSNYILIYFLKSNTSSVISGNFLKAVNKRKTES